MIACIWDYYGPDSKGTAEHFEKHLNEFIKQKNIKIIQTGTTSKFSQAFVWCVGQKIELEDLIYLLKPKHFLKENEFTAFEIFLTPT